MRRSIRVGLLRLELLARRQSGFESWSSRVTGQPLFAARLRIPHVWQCSQSLLEHHLLLRQLHLKAIWGMTWSLIILSRLALSAKSLNSTISHHHPSSCRQSHRYDNFSFSSLHCVAPIFCFLVSSPSCACPYLSFSFGSDDRTSLTCAPFLLLWTWKAFAKPSSSFQ